MPNTNNNVKIGEAISKTPKENDKEIKNKGLEVASKDMKPAIGGYTSKSKVEKFTPSSVMNGLEDLLNANGIYNRSDIAWYEKFSRFGCIDPYNALRGSREYLFFTKPDLHITKPGEQTLNPEISSNTFFNDLVGRYSSVIGQLQKSSNYSSKNPFMALLSNAVKNTLELPGISATTIDLPANIYGTSYSYRGWGYSSDEKVSFSLEFEDTKYLEIYNLFKAYEEYERLKHIGVISPPNIDKAPVVNGQCLDYYTRTKRLHDQFAIYKFIVEDDGETIIYYAKLWGVYPKSVPRDSFSDMKTEGGLTYAIEFDAAFVDDMNPSILTDFNQLTHAIASNGNRKDHPIYNSNKRMIDGRWSTMPVIMKAYAADGWLGPQSMNYTYKLKWRI